MDLNRRLRITTALPGTMSHFVKALTAEQRRAVETAAMNHEKIAMSFEPTATGVKGVVTVGGKS